MASVIDTSGVDHVIHQDTFLPVTLIAARLATAFGQWCRGSCGRGEALARLLRPSQRRGCGPRQEERQW